MNWFGFFALASFFSWVVHRLMNLRFHSLARQWPGPKCHPIFGNTLEFIGSSEKIFGRLIAYLEDFEDIARLWIGPRFFAFLFHPADVEIILRSYEYLDKSAEYDFLRPWIGNGLLTSTGDIWKAQRKAIAPSFHLMVLKTYMKKFNEASRSLVANLEQLVGEPFDIHENLSSSITRALMETSMGVDMEPSDKHFLKIYGSLVDKLSDIVHYRQVKAWWRSDTLFKMSYHAPQQKTLLGSVHDWTLNMMKKKRTSMEMKSYTDADMKNDNSSANGKSSVELPSTNEGFSYGQASGLRDDLDNDTTGGRKKLPFLEALIKRASVGDTFSYQDVHEQINTILFEGHDTTSAASSFFLCALAPRPDVQKRCYDEIQSIMGDSDRDIELEDTNEMKYLEMCIMETMRLYPPVPVMARQVNKEIKMASRDLTIPIGSTVVIATYALHRRADIYPNPNEFNPDNFLPEKSAGRHFYSYIPFSAGPRSCVGMKFGTSPTATNQFTHSSNSHAITTNKPAPLAQYLPRIISKFAAKIWEEVELHKVDDCRKYAMLKLKIMLASIIRRFRIIQVVPNDNWQLRADLILKRRDGYKIGLEIRKSDSPPVSS